MGVPVEAAENEKPKRRWSRLRLAVVVLFSVASLLAIHEYRRHRRVQWLVSEIESIGVDLLMPEPMLEQLWDGQWRVLDREVSLFIDENVDGQWLHEHSYLQDLEICNLYVLESSEPRLDFTRFVEFHPIKEVSVYECADEVAIALEKCATVRIVDFESSDLTDKGFRSLPLEQLAEISIAETQVTSQGVLALKRCRSLTYLSIDGSQMESAVSELTKTRLTLDTLVLKGPAVEDRHLELLIRLNANSVFIEQTSVTAAAVKSLRSRLPDCIVGF